MWRSVAAEWLRACADTWPTVGRVAAAHFRSCGGAQRRSAQWRRARKQRLGSPSIHVWLSRPPSTSVRRRCGACAWQSSAQAARLAEAAAVLSACATARVSLCVAPAAKRVNKASRAAFCRSNHPAAGREASVCKQGVGFPQARRQNSASTASATDAADNPALKATALTTPRRI